MRYFSLVEIAWKVGEGASSIAAFIFFFVLFGFIVSWVQQVTPIIGLNLLKSRTIFIQLRENSNNNNNNNNNSNNSNKQNNILIYTIKLFWKNITKKENDAEYNLI